MHSLAKTRAHQMARRAGAILTPRHWTALEYAWHYYRKHSVGPLFRNIQLAIGMERKEIEQLFPHGISSLYAWIGIPVQSGGSGCKPMALLEVAEPQEVYLDHNATTPLRPEVVEAAIEFLRDPRSYGNPSGAYDIGTLAFDAIAHAREQVAECLSVAPGEIYFVGSGSEANNLALKGLAENCAARGGHIVASCVEHASVLETLRGLETRGFAVTYLPVAFDGTLQPKAVRDALRHDTILVSVMAANNEIGTIYPTAEIGAICRERGIPFAVDAVQAFGKIPLAPKHMGVSLLSGSGHKIGAPKGVGFLYVDSGIRLRRQIDGGAQEQGLRAGTENVIGIVALGLAARLACSEMDSQREHCEGLRSYFLNKLENAVPDAVVHGSLERRLPNNLSIGFRGVDSGSLLLSLNQIGVSVSAGSACSAGANKVSHVLNAIGVDERRFGTVRFSFGRTTTKEQIDYLFEHLPRILEIWWEDRSASRSGQRLRAQSETRKTRGETGTGSDTGSVSVPRFR